MDQVLKGIPNTSCILDDIIITGKTEDEHLKTLEAVLQRLMDYNLRVNETKCKFSRKKLHTADTKKTQMDYTKRKIRLKR